MLEFSSERFVCRYANFNCLLGTVDQDVEDFFKADDHVDDLFDANGQEESMSEVEIDELPTDPIPNGTHSDRGNALHTFCIIHLSLQGYY